MKVRELMTILRKLDPDMRVVVDGFEEGYDDVGYCGIEEMVMDALEPDDLRGSHARVDDLENGEEYETENVLLISHDAPFTIEFVEEPNNDNAGR